MISIHVFFLFLYFPLMLPSSYSSCPVLVIFLSLYPFSFVVFFIGSIFLITLIYGGVMLFRKQKNTLIPLAGAMSLVLIAVLLVQQFTTSFHLYQDLFIINE